MAATASILSHLVAQCTISASVSKACILNHIRLPHLKACNSPRPLRRRIGTIITLGFMVSALRPPARAFDFGLVAPDQTLEQALVGIKEHADGLLDIKEYIESESWKDAQQELRRNAGYLKQDIYTIIQNKPGKERPALRKLYSDLFNDATRLDYAARDMDKVRVLELYHKIVTSLNAILSAI